MRGQSGERLIQRLNRGGIGAWTPGALLPFAPGDAVPTTASGAAAVAEAGRPRRRLPTYHESVIFHAQEVVARRVSSRRRPPAAAAAAASQPHDDVDVSQGVPQSSRPPLNELFNAASQLEEVDLTPRDAAALNALIDTEAVDMDHDSSDSSAPLPPPPPPPPPPVASEQPDTNFMEMPSLEAAPPPDAPAEDPLDIEW